MVVGIRSSTYLEGGAKEGTPFFEDLDEFSDYIVCLGLESDMVAWEDASDLGSYDSATEPLVVVL